ncbi:MAG: NADH:flavin oxidoreductase [Microthrixaceae bacterium]
MANTPDDGVTEVAVDQTGKRSLFEPARLGKLTLRNRFIKAATFEGVSPYGRVTDELIEFHREMAEGGVAMTTVAYMAVASEGRTHRDCLMARTEALGDLRALADAVHGEGALISTQLGHAGPVANASSNGAKSLAPGRMFNPLGLRFAKAADAGDIARVIADYERATGLCVQAGFDALEVHVGHNYLLSSFLSPKLNRRSDAYGGSIENRARFTLEVMRAVRSAAGRDVAVTAKLNMVDGYRGGLNIEDSLQVAKWLQDEDLVDAIELTAGSSLMNPMFYFKGDPPVKEFVETLPWYLRGGFRMVGDKFLKTYPYEEAYFAEMARRFREALDLPLILMGGVSDLETAEAAIAEGFDFVAMGRALLHDPFLIDAYRTGKGSESGCIHCNLCMTTIYTGTHCPISDPWPGDQVPDRYHSSMTNRRSK